MPERIRYTATDFANFLPAFVAALPGSWSYNANDCDGPSTHATLTRSDGLAISLTVDSYRGKFNCYPHVPRSPTGSYQPLSSFLSYEERKAGLDKIDAHCAITRPPATVAKDFARRVIEPYAALFPRIVAQQEERISEQAAFYTAVEQLCRRYGQPFNGERMARETSAAVYPGGGSPIYRIQMSHGYAKIELSSVPLDRLGKVLDAIDGTAADVRNAA